LLALIPLVFIWWLSTQNKSGTARAWEKVIDANLLPLLLGSSKETRNKTQGMGRWILAIAWFLTSIALADPVWEKVPRPIFQTNSARVIILDLSSSMLIADLKPSRLARARFKIEDILSEEFSKKEEGQIGLVLFAGDAFIASPLTRDSETIRSLLEVLKPTIMPSQGSRADLGIKKAQELLSQAGIEKGEVLLIADGVSDQNATLEIVKELKKDGHRLSVLAIGTEAGGILPNLTMQNGSRITVKLETKNLEEIAHIGGGNYHLISTNNSDLISVLAKPFNPNKILEKSEDKESEEWKSMGPFIVLLLLPFAALAFRRGWLFSLFVAVSLVSTFQTKPVLAAATSSPQETEVETSSVKEFWDSLWSNKEQRADKALKQKNYKQVNSLTENPLMQGTAKYKSEEYKAALEHFKQSKGADARYNEGNTLAKLKKYKEAIEAYDKALKQQPKMEDALKNKAAVKKLLEQKKNQKSDDKKNDQDNKNQKDEDQKGDKKDQSGKKGDKGEKDSKDDENQFSDANKKLDKKSDNDSDNNKETDKQNEQDKQNSSDKDSDSKKSKDAPEEEKQSKEEKASKKGEQQKANGDKSEEKSLEKGTKSEAKELSKEEKMAAEQWLRRIPDDPGGLLRRKFERLYQQQRRKRAINNNDQPW